MKLKVYQWQYDEIEHAVWRMKDAKLWLLENLEVVGYTYPPDLPFIFVFFGPEENLKLWLASKKMDKKYVRWAMKPNKIEGLRGNPVRVYDIDGDKTWYHRHFYHPDVRKSIDSMHQMSSMIGRIERLDYAD